MFGFHTAIRQGKKDIPYAAQVSLLAVDVFLNADRTIYQRLP